jgi:hypothetical protein
MRERIKAGGHSSPYRLRKQLPEPVFGQIKQARVKPDARICCIRLSDWLERFKSHLAERITKAKRETPQLSGVSECHHPCFQPSWLTRCGR